MELYKGRYLIAVYDKADNFVDVGANLSDFANINISALSYFFSRNKDRINNGCIINTKNGNKYYLIDCLEQNQDCFAFEDKEFLSFIGCTKGINNKNQNTITDESEAKRIGVSIRTYYRYKAKNNLDALYRKKDLFIIKGTRRFNMPQKISTCKRKTQDDEFYTMYNDVVRELHKYDFRNKKIICPCDNKNSSIYKYLKDCYYNVHLEDKEWRNVKYCEYDVVITNPPFSQINEFLSTLIKENVKFLIIVSDVFRYSIKKKIKKFDIPIYFGKDAQHFYRPDGSIKNIHCGWISNFQDDWKENKIANGE